MKAKLWSWLRFKACVRKIMKEWKSEKAAKAICASIWIKKYWIKKMTAMAVVWKIKK